MRHRLDSRQARLAPAALAVAVAVAGLVSGCGGRAAKPEIAPTAPTAPLGATGGARWLTGRAGRLLTALNADIGRLAAAQRAGDHHAAQSAGARLGADARAALGGPRPPADASAYRLALRDFQRAGTDIASRKYGAASHLIAAGNVGITKVTSAANNLDRPARS
jgi:hypothetical protein